MALIVSQGTGANETLIQSSLNSPTCIAGISPSSSGRTTGRCPDTGADVELTSKRVIR
jgi:hypothetical protein